MPSLYQITPFGAVPNELLGRVGLPDVANLHVRRLRDDLEEIDGGEKALRWVCDQKGIAWEWMRWDYKMREELVEKLQELLERGVFVIIQTTSFPPIVPALQKTDGGWELTREGNRAFVADGVAVDLERRKRDERERKKSQDRNQPPNPEVVEPAGGPGTRPTTLGPHEGNEAQVFKVDTFETQHAAAMFVSQKILPTSISEDIEYGGMIYRNNDGTYGYTGPIKGEEGSVNPGGPKSVPSGTTAVAYWHTHGAYNPSYDSENFSNYYDEELKAHIGDIPYAKHHGIDAYVVTPKGNFKHYSVTKDSEELLGKLKLE